jgi:hypothetical protein
VGAKNQGLEGLWWNRKLWQLDLAILAANARGLIAEPLGLAVGADLAQSPNVKHGMSLILDGMVVGISCTL